MTECSTVPCSQSRTSILGGMLRALLAMCFSKVVFPFLIQFQKSEERFKTKTLTNTITLTTSLASTPMNSKIWLITCKTKPMNSPIWSNQTVSSSSNNQKVCINKQLFTVSRNAESFQLQTIEQKLVNSNECFQTAKRTDSQSNLDV